MWLRTGGKWLRFAIVSMIYYLTFAPEKARLLAIRLYYMPICTGICSASGLLCSPEHSKICFQPLTTSLAAENSLLC